MSKITDSLRAIGHYNTYGLLATFSDKGQDVGCSYSPPEPRACRGHTARVFSPSHQTDPGSAWYEHGMKTFVGRISESLPAAMAWASEKYGVREWVPCPFNRSARIPAIVRKRALAALKETR